MDPGDEPAPPEGTPTAPVNPLEATAVAAGGEGPAADPTRALVRERLFGNQGRSSIGRFEVLEALGQGGMGVVYRARDPELDRAVAVKLLHAETSSSAESRARLRREAQALARVSHPNVVHVYEVGEHENAVFVAMELVEGQTLRDWLGETERSSPEILDMFVQAGAGLIAAHQAGLVHRDFKPDNVLVGPDLRPRVVDFGLARAETAVAASKEQPSGERLANDATVSITIAGAIAGTPAYMAPEQWTGQTTTDARTDQFAFCVALYEALMGERPFHGPTLPELRAAVLAGRVQPTERGTVARLVLPMLLRGLQRDPMDRYPTMSALLTALGKATTPRSYRVGLWAIAAAAVGGLALWGVVVRNPPPPPSDLAAAPENVTDSEVAAILAASDLPKLYPAPHPADPTGVTVHRLDNGLTVYLCSRREVPRIEGRIVLRVGSAYDPLRGHGAAQLLARVTKHGSARLGTRDWEAERPFRSEIETLIGRVAGADDATRQDLFDALARAEAGAAEFALVGEYDRVIRELGITAGIRVNRTATQTEADLPADHLGLWLQLEAERLQRPVMRGFVRETIGAIRELEAPPDPRNVQYDADAVAQGLYPDSAWAHPSAGDIEHLAGFPLHGVQDLHRQWYAPNNAAIVLVGDFEPSSAVATIRDHFASWTPRPLPERPRRPTPTHREAHVTSTVALQIAWPLPEPADDDAIATLLASEALHQGLDTPLPAFTTGIAAGFWLPDWVETDRARAQRDLEKIAREGLADDALEDAGTEDIERALEREVAREYADKIAGHYASGRAWDTAVRETELQGEADRAAVDAHARRLASTYVSIRGEAPKPRAETSALPNVPNVSPTPEATSGFARDLLAAQTINHEPQFIVEGRHYYVRRGPGGTAIGAHCDQGLEHIALVVKPPTPSAVNCPSWTTTALAYATAVADSSSVGGTLSANCGPSGLTIEVHKGASDPAHAWVVPLPQWLDAVAPSELEAQISGGVARTFAGVFQGAEVARRISTLHRRILWPTLQRRESGALHTPTSVRELRGDWAGLADHQVAYLY